MLKDNASSKLLTCLHPAAMYSSLICILSVEQTPSHAPNKPNMSAIVFNLFKGIHRTKISAHILELSSLWLLFLTVFPELFRHIMIDSWLCDQREKSNEDYFLSAEVRATTHLEWADIIPKWIAFISIVSLWHQCCNMC